MTEKQTMKNLKESLYRLSFKLQSRARKLDALGLEDRATALRAAANECSSAGNELEELTK